MSSVPVLHWEDVDCCTSQRRRRRERSGSYRIRRSSNRIRGPVSSRAGAALAHPLKRTTSANIESHTLKKIKSDPYFELKFEFYISIQDILHIILFYRLIRKSSSRTYK